MLPSGGKIYWEVIFTTADVWAGTGIGEGGDSSYSLYVNGNGNTTYRTWQNDVGPLAPFVNGDVLGIAFDTVAKVIWLRHNLDAWNAVAGADPATGTGGFALIGQPHGDLPGPYYALLNGEGAGTNQSFTANFGASTFAFVPPAGFMAANGGPAMLPSVWSASDAAANAMTLSNGGLTVVNTVGVWQSIRGTISRTAGKYYVEFLCANSPTTPDTGFGIADTAFAASSYLGSSNYSCGWSNSNGTSGQSAPAGFTIIGGSGIHQAVLNDVMQLAIDLTSVEFWYGINNVWGGSGNPATGANPNITISAPALGLAFFPAMSTDNPTAGLWTLQPTAASQKYAPPTGFSAWDGGASLKRHHKPISPAP